MRLVSQKTLPVAALPVAQGAALARRCAQPPSRTPRPHLGRHKHSAVTQAADGAAVQTAEVERITGVRLVPLEERKVMSVEYRLKWKDDMTESWEPARNVAEDVLRDFEARWWGTARKGDANTMAEMLAGGREVLATTIDENGRTALHFACGVGSDSCVRLLLANGADVSAEDKVGYTPLHIAAGYLHRGVARILLEAGADPELADKKERSARDLVAALKEGTPTTPEFFSRRGALDDMAAELDSHLFEELQPRALLAKRVEAAPVVAPAEGEPPAAVPTGVEYLVHWGDGTPDTWEPDRNVSDDLVADFEAGLEYASAAAVTQQRRAGGATEYLVAWEDGQESSWQVEEQVAEEVMRSYLDARKAEKRGNKPRAQLPSASSAAPEELAQSAAS